MLTYLNAKCVELEARLVRLHQRISRIEKNSRHPVLVSQLYREEDALHESLHRLTQIAQLGLETLIRRGETILILFQERYGKLQDRYLPALIHEGEEERAFACLIKHIIGCLGITHMHDLVASQGRPLAIFPAIAEAPIFYFPLNQKHTVIGLAGLYHEIGHSVYQQNSGLKNTLAAVVTHHFENLARSTPPLPQAQQEQRLKVLKWCSNYWTGGRIPGSRIVELFCDVFASLLTGPAYVYSWIDLTISHAEDPYHIDIYSEHPPFAFRADACLYSMDLIGYRSALLDWIRQVWVSFVEMKRKPQDPLPYDLVAPQQLISALVDKMLEEISGLGFKVYERPCPNPSDALTFTNILEIENLLNAAAVNLVWNSASYDKWERDSLSSLYEALSRSSPPPE